MQHRFRHHRLILLITILHLSTIVAATVWASEPQRVVQGRRGMVVSVSAPASEAGRAILQQEGNAVDAAVATALALAVTYPQAGNIGGGGFMMIHPGPNQSPVCVDYRETAPAAATPEMFAIDESRFGHKIIGVPGTVRGLATAHAKYGRLPWNRLVQPAIKLAEEGFLLDAHVAKSLNELLSEEATRPFAELQRVFAPPPRGSWQAGDRLVQPDLAGTLRLLASQGPDAFYQGVIAQQIVAEMQHGPAGLITADDLAGYQARIRQPIHCRFRGCDVYGPPPPSSGGVCLCLMLNMLETFDLDRQGRWSVDALHLLVESMRRAYLDRARFLGDSDYVQIPAELTSKDYARRLAAQIDRRRATSSEALARSADLPLAAEGTDTTHFSIVDSHGMAVSNTYTLEHSYGSRVVVRGAGFLLNNEMGDFNWKPGYTDRQGNIGTPANSIAPGKRMLSSQTPVLVTRDGRIFLVVGSPGGRTIINTSLQIVLNVIEFEMDLPAAVAAPRLHHQWLPDVVRIEQSMLRQQSGVIEQLRQMGHTVETSPQQGDAHCILVDGEGRLLGVADDRISGSAAGW